jgi:hypothetical protein
MEKKGEKLAPFNPTTDGAIDAAIEMLRITEQDVVFELGCGDARFLTTATTRCGSRLAQPNCFKSKYSN